MLEQLIERMHDTRTLAMVFVHHKEFEGVTDANPEKWSDSAKKIAFELERLSESIRDNASQWHRWKGSLALSAPTPPAPMVKFEPQMPPYVPEAPLAITQPHPMKQRGGLGTIELDVKTILVGLALFALVVWLMKRDDK